MPRADMRRVEYALGRHTFKQHHILSPTVMGWKNAASANSVTCSRIEGVWMEELLRKTKASTLQTLKRSIMSSLVARNLESFPA